jgi:hypothetical protein
LVLVLVYVLVLVLVLVFAYVLCIDVCSLCSYCVSHLRSSHSLCLRVRLYLGVCILSCVGLIESLI